jgi:hypothetical protein
MGLPPVDFGIKAYTVDIGLDFSAFTATSEISYADQALSLTRRTISPFPEEKLGVNSTEHELVESVRSKAKSHSITPKLTMLRETTWNEGGVLNVVVRVTHELEVCTWHQSFWIVYSPGSTFATVNSPSEVCVVTS